MSAREIGARNCEKAFAPAFAYQYEVLYAGLRMLSEKDKIDSDYIDAIKAEPSFTSTQRNIALNEAYRKIEIDRQLSSDKVLAELDNAEDGIYNELKQIPDFSAVERKVLYSTLSLVKSKTLTLAVEDFKIGRKRTRSGAELQIKISACSS